MRVNASRVNLRVDAGRVRDYIRRVGDAGVANAREVLSENTSPPSSPGQPPARRTGFLADSFETRDSEDGVEVYSTADYARYLEDGTSKMDERPFMGEVVRRTAVDARRLPVGKVVALR